jgi:integrase
MAIAVSVGVDKGCLRLQFTTSISQRFWGKKQKYKGLGLRDNPENRQLAEDIAYRARQDIRNNNFDVTLKRYEPHALLESSEQINFKIPTLLELYLKYIEEVKKPAVTKGTYKGHYKTACLNIIKRCADADIIEDSVSIFDKIKSSTTPNEAKKLLNLLFNVLEWCKRRNIVKKETYNPYKDYIQDVPGKSKRMKPPAHIIEQNLDSKDRDYRGFLPQEAEKIIESFSERGQTPKLYNRLLRFLFLTGCRPSEAIGLQWGDISEDCTIITFRHAYCLRTKELKGGKNARYEGKEKRVFPCGEKLRNLLLEIKSETQNPANYIFLTAEGEPIPWGSFRDRWAGVHNGSHETNGVVEELAQTKKIRFYLKPYATRHSFITWQLKAGMTPANVAKLVGNSPEMIYKHYVSADEDAKVAFEV